MKDFVLLGLFMDQKRTRMDDLRDELTERITDATVDFVTNVREISIDVLSRVFGTTDPKIINAIREEFSLDEPELAKRLAKAQIDIVTREIFKKEITVEF